MKFRRIISMLTALCLGASVCSCSAPADTGTAPTEITAEEENMTNTYILNEENVKLISSGCMVHFFKNLNKTLADRQINVDSYLFCFFF